MHLLLQLGCLLPNGPPLLLMWAGLAELCCVREGNMKQSRGHTMEKKRHPAASRLPLTCYKQVRESAPHHRHQIRFAAPRSRRRKQRSKLPTRTSISRCPTARGDEDARHCSISALTPL
uniref:Secreted protein n=1 Tax=Triticum urartu TaxID=4572 RepID=A0A8R7TQF2_TRIUA